MYQPGNFETTPPLKEWCLDVEFHSVSKDKGSV